MYLPPLPTFPGQTRLLSGLFRWLAWFALVVGIVIGLAWATLHFWIVPRIGDYRPALERLAQQSIGVPLRIGHISAESTGWAPSFELRDIELLDPEGRTALRLPKVLIAISVRSVMGLKLEQLVLDAPELDIRLTADGAWRVAGLDMSQNTSDGAAADWLFAQREIIVRGGVVRWTNERALKGPASLALRDVDVVLRNSARHHDVRVDATPTDDWGQRFVTVGRFKRGLLSLQAGSWADWSGQAVSYTHLTLPTILRV